MKALRLTGLLIAGALFFGLLVYGYSQWLKSSQLIPFPKWSESAEGEVYGDFDEERRTVEEDDIWPEDKQPLNSTSTFGGKTCGRPIASNFSEILVPLQRREAKYYLLPRWSTRSTLSDARLENDTTFIFIHVNKAGGTLFKEEVLGQVAKVKEWDGAGYGSTVGWAQLLRCKASQQSSFAISNEAISCGKSTTLLPCGPQGGGKCPLRLLWGTHSMGFCELYPDRPCVMTLVLRDPVERIISQYNDVCVEGKEDRKKWLPAWKEAGRCPLTLLEFMETSLTSKTFLIDHLARTAEPACAADIALHNLRHPCLRYMLLSKLSDGLTRLSKVWGPSMRPHLERVARLASSDAGKRNRASYGERIRSQIEDPKVMQRVKELIKEDIEFYQQAMDYYEVQWSQPLESCTNV